MPDVFVFLQEVLTQGRELAERANEMSMRNLRDKRPLQTASKVLLSDLTSFRSKVENTKKWLEDAINFYTLLMKVELNNKTGSKSTFFPNFFSFVLQESGS